MKHNLRCLVTLLIVSILSASCGKSGKTDASDIQETAQQVGDVMASIDEMGASTGTYSLRSPTEDAANFFARVSPPTRFGSALENLFTIRNADAVRCALANTWGACSSLSGISTLTRTFGGCTVGNVTFTGTVAISYQNLNACSYQSGTAATITRVPNFTATGRRDATLTVTKTAAIGQRLTYTMNGQAFVFSSDGIQRVFKNAANVVVFDYKTETTANVGVVGTNRAGRVVNGGTVRVTNNVSAVTCDYTPTNVTYNSACNCAVSGNWAGTCSDGKNTSLVIDGCGTGTLTIGSATNVVAFDRCGNLN